MTAPLIQRESLPTASVDILFTRCEQAFQSKDYKFAIQFLSNNDVDVLFNMFLSLLEGSSLESFQVLWDRIPRYCLEVRLRQDVFARLCSNDRYHVVLDLFLYFTRVYTIADIGQSISSEDTPRSTWKIRSRPSVICVTNATLDAVLYQGKIKILNILLLSTDILDLPYEPTMLCVSVNTRNNEKISDSATNPSAKNLNTYGPILSPIVKTTLLSRINATRLHSRVYRGISLNSHLSCLRFIMLVLPSGPRSISFSDLVSCVPWVEYTHLINLIILVPNLIVPNRHITLSQLVHILTSCRRLLMASNEIGRGGYGRVYRPPLRCSEQTQAVPILAVSYEGVSKLMTKTDADKEIQSYQRINLSKLDPQGRFHIRLQHSCVLDPECAAVNMLSDIKNRRGEDMTQVLLYENGGIDLRHILDNSSRYSLAEVLLALRAIVSGICTLGRAGIFHLDIKSENIVGSENEERLTLRMIDFGLAVRFGSYAPLPCNIFLTAYTWPFEMSYMASTQMDKKTRVARFNATLGYESAYGVADFDRIDEELGPLAYKTGAVFKSGNKTNINNHLKRGSTYYEASYRAYSSADIFQFGRLLEDPQLLGPSHPFVRICTDVNIKHRANYTNMEELYELHVLNTLPGYKSVDITRT